MKVIGHRGWAGSFPENSLEGVRAALALGVAGVEIDVRTTADGELVVVHDPTTGRTGSVDLVVAETPLTDLRRVLLTNGEPIPTLGEILAAVPAGRVVLVEVKPQPPERFLTAWRRAEAQWGPLAVSGRLVVMSFSLGILQAVHGSFPQLPTWLLTEASAAAVLRKVAREGVLPPGVVGLAPQHSTELSEASWGLLGAARVAESALLLAEERSGECPQRVGRGVGSRLEAVWTVNDPEAAEQWRQRGASWLISDFPERFLGFGAGGNMISSENREHSGRERLG